MNKKTLGLLIVIISAMVFCLSGFIAIVNLGFSAGGGIPPAGNDALVVIGCILMFCSAIAFIIGVGMFIYGIFATSSTQNNSIDTQDNKID